MILMNQESKLKKEKNSEILKYKYNISFKIIVQWLDFDSTNI